MFMVCRDRIENILLVAWVQIKHGRALSITKIRRSYYQLLDN